MYTGTTLFYLADTTDSSAYELLAQQHREYEDIMQTLAVLYQDGVISAPCAGAISGIDVDAAAKLQAEYNRRFGLAETIAYSVPVENNKVMDDPGNEYSGTVIKISSVNGNDVQYQSLPNQVVIGADMSFKDISYYSNFAYGISENAEKKYLDSDVTCVQNINDAGWEPYNNIEKDDVFLLVNSTDISGSGSSKTYAILLGNIPSQKSDPVNPVNPDNNKGNDMNGMGNMSGFSGMGGSSFTSGTGGEEFVMYSSDGTVCMSVTPQETISISITVDELDVLSVQKGSEAKLTIDAFPGREYAGTVTDLSRKATNSGGNSKYTAEITFDREDTMLPGMNASSLITVSTAENVLMLPAKSLTEDGLRTLVYTTYDEKTGLLGGEKEVTTGVSDGENVQILSGISEGDTVYYAYEDSIELESLFGGMPGAPGGFGGFTGGGPSGGGPGGGFSGGPGRD